MEKLNVEKATTMRTKSPGVYSSDEKNREKKTNGNLKENCDSATFMPRCNEVNIENIEKSNETVNKQHFSFLLLILVTAI